ncbi:MAG TPA: universal stress protein [Steroidobacteraceae bacterium]|nr:universal stress protein [Steroidobacteraceae bacterium]
MKRRQIMFAVRSPGRVGAMELAKVAQLASGLDAEVDLFHCMFDRDIARPERVSSEGVEEDIKELADRRRRRLEYTAERLRAQGVRVCTSVRWDYPVYAGIVRQVLRLKPILLVAQSSRRGRAARLVLTQTDYKLIETCPCPVLFIKNGQPYGDTVILAAVDPARAHGKPAALDDAILDAAEAIRSALKGSLRVFHAGPPWDGARAMRDLGTLPEGVQDDVHGAYSRSIETPVLELARRHKIPGHLVEVLEGDTAELLPGVAWNESAQIVALGAVSRSRLGRALIGHTAERLLDALVCDVLVVKPPAFETPVSRASTHHIARSVAQSLPML